MTELNQLFYYLILAVLCSDSTAITSNWGPWSVWGPCSTTCDIGVKTRTRQCEGDLNLRCEGPSKQQHRCHELVCPSYLDVPRFSFSGKYEVDSPTNNNIRCFFDTEYFSPVLSTGRGEQALKITTEDGSSKHRFARVSYNPMGNGHFDFYKTKVTTVCWEGKKCTNGDPLVRRKIVGTNSGRMVDLDNDWMDSPEVIGYTIHVEGVFTARMENGPSRQITTRIASIAGGDSGKMASIKSKLVNVQWIDPYYKHKFRNATSLSISFVMDLFNVREKGGRLVGSIGMTSQDDPLNVYGGRVLRPIKGELYYGYEIPLFINERMKKISLDLSSFVKSDRTGNFNIKYQLGYVDVFLLPSKATCKMLNCKKNLYSCGGTDVVLLSRNGALSHIQKSNQWYNLLGGIVQLGWTQSSLYTTLATHRIGIINRVSLHPQSRKKPFSYTLCDMMPHMCSAPQHKSKSTCSIVAIEDESGINFKPTGGFTKRLSRGETWNIQTVATKFGKPLEGADMGLLVMKSPALQSTCSGTKATPCSPYIGRPRNAVSLSESTTTNEDGIANLSIRVVSNPGNPRGCGMDGTVYKLGLTFAYQPPHGKLIKMADGGMFSSAIESSTMPTVAENQCGLTATRFTFGFMLKVFSSLPASVMRKRCPSWSKDIRPIFQLYYNLFPVMAKHDIINLRSVGDVRAKLRMINMSMFEYDWDHPNFMPTTRDLSPDKTEVVRRWLECEMNGETVEEISKAATNEELIQNKYTVCGTPAKITKTMKEIREIIQMGIWVELYTIPPYMSAMLSLKRVKHKEIYNLFKSVTTEEMLHLVLDANVLNSVGGSPNTTDSFWLPDYPTTFPSKDFYQIRPDITLKIAPFSIAMVKDVFSEIEKPASASVMKVLHKIALMWDDLPQDKGGRWKAFDKTETYYDSIAKKNTTGPVWVHRAKNIRASMPETVEREEEENIWRVLFQTSTELLEEPEVADVYTIGGYYAHAMLRLIQAEACVKMHSINDTVFTGDTSRQFGPKQWYVTKGLSSASLFPVHGLRSAVEALMEVVYEGEGGSPCAPYITNMAGKPISSFDQALSSPFGSEKSHYIKFQEMVHGRKLVAVTKLQPQWAKDKCLDYRPDICGDEQSMLDFCFQGESIGISEINDVFPERSVQSTGSTSSVKDLAKYAISRFSRSYTSLLQCLERSMNGHVLEIKKCMGLMYELLSAGKSLVQSHNKEPNQLMWTYQRDPYKLEGLRLSDMPKSNIHFC